MCVYPPNQLCVLCQLRSEFSSVKSSDRFFPRKSVWGGNKESVIEVGAGLFVVGRFYVLISAVACAEHRNGRVLSRRGLRV